MDDIHCKPQRVGSFFAYLTDINFVGIFPAVGSSSDQTTAGFACFFGGLAHTLLAGFYYWICRGQNFGNIWVHRSQELPVPNRWLEGGPKFFSPGIGNLSPAGGGCPLGAGIGGPGYPKRKGPPRGGLTQKYTARQAIKRDFGGKTHLCVGGRS